MALASQTQSGNLFLSKLILERPYLSGTKIASQNRSDHGGRKRARNHSAAEIAGFFASLAAKKSLAASDFGVRLKIAGSSQRPRPQVAAAARFRGRSDHGTLRPIPTNKGLVNFAPAQGFTELPGGQGEGCKLLCLCVFPLKTWRIGTGQMGSYAKGVGRT